MANKYRDADLTHRDKWIASIAFNAGKSGVWETCPEWLKDCADTECNSAIEDALAHDAPKHPAEKALQKIAEPEHYDVTALHGAAEYFRCIAVYALSRLST